MNHAPKAPRQSRPFALLAALLVQATLLGGCGQEAPKIAVTLIPEAIAADGKATARVTINLEGFDAPVLLSTSRGTFQDSGAERTVVQLIAGQATAVLVACDEVIDPGCPGNASLVATAGEEVGFGIITLLGG